MSGKLLDIHPRELNFTFEVKKQSSCAIQLSNVSDQYVAFKVKTTSPKTYCVRPNTGVIKPNSRCDFTVIMQAPRSPLSDLECKDKFLVQSTVVPIGTTEEDITSDLFSKGGGKYVEENKLRVVLISPSHFPLYFNKDLEEELSHETGTEKENFAKGVEDLSLLHVPNVYTGHVPTAINMEKLNQNGSEDEKPTPAKTYMFSPVKDVQSSIDMNSPKLNGCEGDQSPPMSLTVQHVKDAKPILVKDMEGKEPRSAKSVNFNLVNDVKPKSLKDDQEAKLRLTNEMKELKLKTDILEHQLTEAKLTISDLHQQNRKIVEAKESLKQQLAKRRNGVKRIKEGFSFLFLCMVALISLSVGYRLHS